APQPASLHQSRCPLELRTFYPCPSFVSHTSPTQIYTLSLHDALPICFTIKRDMLGFWDRLAYSHAAELADFLMQQYLGAEVLLRSEEHTSELQSRGHLVCRLLLEKKKVAEQVAERRGGEAPVVDEEVV